MAKTSPTLDLRELVLRGGERTERSIPVEIAPITLGGLRYDVLVDGGEAHVEVARVTGGYLVTLSLRATVYGPCSRCLREMSLTVEPTQEEFVPQNPGEWDPEDVSPFIVDLVVDVGALAREAVILALPTKLLCREDCRGICPACGGDLNEDTCSCGTLDTDPRWEKLRGLVERTED